MWGEADWASRVFLGDNWTTNFWKLYYVVLMQTNMQQVPSFLAPAKISTACVQEEPGNEAMEQVYWRLLRYIP